MDITKFITDPEIALLIIMIVAAISAFATGKVVPDSMYKREVARADKATEVAEKVVAALRDVTEGLKDSTEAIKDLTAEVRRK